MPISAIQLARHYADHRALLREYFPRADARVIDAYLEALRAYDQWPTGEALHRLSGAHRLIALSIPTIDLEHEA